MSKRKARQTHKSAAVQIGVPGASRLTNAELQAAWMPARDLIDMRERIERNRLESVATEMHDRFPDARNRIENWLRTQTEELAELVGGLRDSLRAFADRTAEGEKFRTAFLDMTPAQVDEYLLAHPIDAAWLAGFTKDREVKRAFYSQIAKLPRPGARGKSKWAQPVHDVAQRCYREWCDGTNRADGKWIMQWSSFATICLEQIKTSANAQVTESQLRRQILPAGRFPRPR